MKRFLALFAVLILAFSISCTGLRQNAIDLSEEYLANRDTAKQIAINLHETWPMRSGFIKGSLFNDFDKLDQEVTKAINELDAYSDIAVEDLTDEQLGKILGLRARLLSETVAEVFEQLDLDVMKIIF